MRRAELRQAEIPQAQFAWPVVFINGEQDVGGLHVAKHYPAPMCVAQCFQQLEHDCYSSVRILHA